MSPRKRIPVDAIRRQFGSHLRGVRGRLALSYALGLLSVVASLALPWPLKWLIDSILPGHLGTSRFGATFSDWAVGELIVTAAAVFFLSSVFARGASALQRLVDARTRERLALDLRIELVEHLTRLSPILINDHRSGELVTRVVSDANLFVRLITKTLPQFFKHGATIVLALMALFWMAPELGWFGCLVVPFLALISRHFARPLSDAARTKRRAEGELGGITQEVMRGLPALQASGESAGAVDRFAVKAQRALSAGMAETRIGVSMESALQIAQAAILSLVIGGGAMLVADSRISVGVLTVFVSYITQLLKPIEKINELSTALARGLAAGERLLEIRSLPILISERQESRDPVEVFGVMEFRGVYFRYPGLPDRMPWILEDASMTIEPGALTVITGQSGVGKSTTLHLLARLFDPDRGSVLLDGHPLPKISMACLRGNLTTLSQRGHLFAGTVREAISGANTALTDSEVWEALEQVHLANTIRRSANGLDSVFGEDAANLSGGERRRLDLARAIASGRKIILLDEPTTGVDEKSLDAILDALAVLARERTLLVVSHQPDLLNVADRLFELTSGRLHLVRDKLQNDPSYAVVGAP